MFVITGKIGNEICSIRCDSIKNIHKKCKDTDTAFVFNDLAFAGDKIAIEKMLKENAIDHGYLGVVPSGCEFRENYLSGEFSSAELICSHVFDDSISMKDDWRWRDAPKGVVF